VYTVYQCFNFRAHSIKYNGKVIIGEQGKDLKGGSFFNVSGGSWENCSKPQTTLTVFPAEI
jgi:hypothetical protein